MTYKTSAQTSMWFKRLATVCASVPLCDGAIGGQNQEQSKGQSSGAKHLIVANCCPRKVPMVRGFFSDSRSTVRDPSEGSSLRTIRTAVVFRFKPQQPGIDVGKKSVIDFLGEDATVKCLHNLVFFHL
jgi:hypothetical protein